MLKMNKRRVNELIPKVIEYIPSSGILIDNEIPNEFKGYVSSFGASIIQSGILSTVAFFSNPDSAAKKDRVEIINIIYNIMDKKFPHNKEEGLLSYLLNNKEHIDDIKEEIINVAIALKLGMRVFKFK